MGEGMAFIGLMGAFFSVVGLFMGFTELLILLPIGLILVWIGISIDKDDQKRHQADYGNVARCPKCGSTRVYAMTYDDKRGSISFWGAASSKIGKCFHCDNCGNEW